MITEGMNILEQIPIKEYTTLSMIFMVTGISIAIIATLIFFIKTKPKSRISFKDTITKIFFLFYILGLVVALSSIIHIPCFYTETGRYTYKCTFEDDVNANCISENFNIIGVEDKVWTVEDK